MTIPTDTTLRLDIHDSVSDVAEEWDALADLLQLSPFLRPDWFGIWSRAFGSGHERIITARRSGRLVGVLPLQAAPLRATACRSEPFPRLARPGTLRSLTNWQSPAFAPVASDDAVVRVLLGGAFDHAHSMLSFAMIDPDSSAATDLAAIARARDWQVVSEPLPPSPWIPTAGVGDFRSQLAAKTRQNLRRRRRRLDEQGCVRVARYDGRDRLEELLADGFRLEASGWKDEAGSAIRSRPETLRFYTELARWAAERGWLALSFLELDGQRLAFKFGLEHGGRYYALKGGFDPRWSTFSPGTQLEVANIEHAVDAGLDSYELLGGDEDWKLVLTDRVRPRAVLHAFAPGPWGRLERFGVERARPATIGLRRHLRPLKPYLASVERAVRRSP
jgi:CelD/BcsL family acetyltransferase involved in cellulose biosynthesis